jgi:hypothetical protein
METGMSDRLMDVVVLAGLSMLGAGVVSLWIGDALHWLAEWLEQGKRQVRMRNRQSGKSRLEVLLALVAVVMGLGLSACAVLLDDRCPRGLMYRHGMCEGIPADGGYTFHRVPAKGVW